MTELLDPASILDVVAAHLPKSLHRHVLIVGSLAAAYSHRAQLVGGKVSTKDADVIVHPAGAIAKCAAIAQKLLDNDWRRRTGPTNACYPRPSAEPLDQLTVIRLNPPKDSAYFLELLALPRSDQKEPKRLNPCRLEDGWYSIPSFRFTSVLAHEPAKAACDLAYATPAMMSLSNLLSHQEIGKSRISEPLATGGRLILRASKDLGRVLALARLAAPDALEEWHEHWADALRARFPSSAADLAEKAGSGLKRLVEDEAAFDDALYAVQVGLLAGLGVTRTELLALVREVDELALKPLATSFSRKPRHPRPAKKRRPK